MKKFVEVGYQVLHLEEKEVELLEFLSKHNLLKFSPKEIEVYGFNEKEKE